jgi:hydroxymethylpyrimidine/phosphomethylpyrimidine kinase
MVSRALTIATSDSGGGAGIQADLKAFAAAGVYGSSVLVALTAQNTRAVTAIHDLPPEFVMAQLDAVFDDIGVDVAKTGMLFSRVIIETVAAYLARRPVPLVVDPVMVASSGAKLLEDDAVDALVGQLFPLATVVTPNLMEARALTGTGGSQAELAERLHALGASAVIVTGGHGESKPGAWAEPTRPFGAVGEPTACAVDHLYDGREHVDIPVARYAVAATHGAGCTHSATLAALLARGESLADAARGAAEAASRAVAQGLVEIGSGEGPVDILGVRR